MKRTKKTLERLANLYYEACDDCAMSRSSYERGVTFGMALAYLSAYNRLAFALYMDDVSDEIAPELPDVMELTRKAKQS